MSTFNKELDSGPGGKLLRNYRRTYGPSFQNGTPKWWRKLYMTRPRRRANKHVCRLVLQGRAPDGLVLPLGNSKPHVYYW